MLRKRTLVAVCLTLFALVAVCGCSPRGAAPPPRARAEEPYDFKSEGRIPPLQEKDVREEPDIEEMPAVEESLGVEEVSPVVDSALAATGIGEKGREGSTRSGFRVQVFASLSSATAEEVKDSFERELGVEAYVEYVDGMYKVRLGDFLSRREAEEFLARCRKAGHKDAWIVPARVNVKHDG
jgi:hypothetical protein